MRELFEGIEMFYLLIVVMVDDHEYLSKLLVYTIKLMKRMSFIVYKLYFNKTDENVMPFWALLYTSSFEWDIKQSMDGKLGILKRAEGE